MENSMNQPNSELEQAVEIQRKTYKAVSDVVMQIVGIEGEAFPNYPLMVPTLCLAALCQCVSSYIETFPDSMKSNIISMAYNTIGFPAFQDPNNLANMEVVGHA